MNLYKPFALTALLSTLTAAEAASVQDTILQVDGVSFKMIAVQEWVEDYYGPYTASPQRDPRGPVAGAHHVVRGGSQMVWNLLVSWSRLDYGTTYTAIVEDDQPCVEEIDFRRASGVNYNVESRRVGFRSKHNFYVDYDTDRGIGLRLAYTPSADGATSPADGKAETADREALYNRFALRLQKTEGQMDGRTSRNTFQFPYGKTEPSESIRKEPLRHAVEQPARRANASQAPAAFAQRQISPEPDPHRQTINKQTILTLI